MITDIYLYGVKFLIIICAAVMLVLNWTCPDGRNGLGTTVAGGTRLSPEVIGQHYSVY